MSPEDVIARYQEVFRLHRFIGEMYQDCSTKYNTHAKRAPYLQRRDDLVNRFNRDFINAFGYGDEDVTTTDSDPDWLEKD